MNDLHGILFAYGPSPAMRELTQIRNICSMPYGGRYRLVDFSLSNLVNAGVTDVGVIVHSSYQSLLDHMGSGKDWDLSRSGAVFGSCPPSGTLTDVSARSTGDGWTPWPGSTPT